MPALRRPCTPSQMPAVNRSASTSNGGKAEASRSASSRGRSQSSCCVAVDAGAVLAIMTLWPVRRIERLEICLAEAVDHLGDGGAFGTRREIQCHTVTQDRMRERDPVVYRGSEAAFQLRARPDRQHEGLTRARARPPGDEAANRFAGIVV